MTAIGALVMLAALLATDAFAAGTEVVTATDNGITITFTYPSNIRPSIEYSVTAQISADDPADTLDWGIDKNDSTIDSGSGADNYITRTITATSATSGPDKWHVYATLIGQSNYCYTTEYINQNNNCGGPAGYASAKYFIGASYVDLASGNLFLDYQCTFIKQTAGNNLPHNCILAIKALTKITGILDV